MIWMSGQPVHYTVDPGTRKHAIYADGVSVNDIEIDGLNSVGYEPITAGGSAIRWNTSDWSFRIFVNNASLEGPGRRSIDFRSVLQFQILGSYLESTELQFAKSRHGWISSHVAGGSLGAIRLGDGTPSGMCYNVIAFGMAADSFIADEHCIGCGAISSLFQIKYDNRSREAVTLSVWGAGSLPVDSSISGKVSVGTLRSTAGGVVFPDGSTQTTATLQGPVGPQGEKGDAGFVMLPYSGSTTSPSWALDVTNSGGGGAIRGTTTTATGIVGVSTGGAGVGVRAESQQGVGLIAAGGAAAMQLVPGATTGPPTSGSHQAGELYVDAAGSLFHCRAAGTPGTWVAVEGTEAVRPYVQYSRDAEQQILNQVSTPIAYNFVELVASPYVDFDTGAFRFTAPVGGIYRVSAAVTYDNPAGSDLGTWRTGNRAEIHIKRNGELQKLLGAVTIAATFKGHVSVTGSADIAVAAGDTIQIVTEQNSGIWQRLYPSKRDNWVTINYARAIP